MALLQIDTVNLTQPDPELESQYIMIVTAHTAAIPTEVWNYGVTEPTYATLWSALETVADADGNTFGL